MGNGWGRARWPGTGALLVLLGGCMVPPVETAGDYTPPGQELGPSGQWGHTMPPERDVAGAPVYAEQRRSDPVPVRDARTPTYPAGSIDGYYWIDVAEELAGAIGSAPPDFAFGFEGRNAYAWVSSAGETMIVEPSPGGVVQYFYHSRAAAPYLVRDVYESYAFDGPEFVAWYDGEGRIADTAPPWRAQDDAARLHERGRAIMAASYQRRWDGNVARSYSSQSFIGFSFGIEDSGWSGGWRPRWRERSEWREVRRRRAERGGEAGRDRGLQEERRRRADAAQRFDGWRRGGRRGAPPVATGGGIGADAVAPVDGGRSRPATPAVPVSADTPAVVRRPRVPEDASPSTVRSPRPARDTGVVAFQPATEVLESEAVAPAARSVRDTGADLRGEAMRNENTAAAAVREQAEADARAETQRAASQQREAGRAARAEDERSARAAAVAEAERAQRDASADDEAAAETARRAREQSDANARAEAEAREREQAEVRERAAQAEASARAQAEAEQREADARARTRADAEARAQAEAQAPAEAAERGAAGHRPRSAEAENSAERPE